MSATDDLVLDSDQGIGIIGELRGATLDVDSGGAITDPGTASSAMITSNASFNATNTVVLDGNNYEFGSLTVSGSSVSIKEADSTNLVGNSGATFGAFGLESGGDITQDATSNIVVVQQAAFVANLGTSDVTLVDGSNTFGNLRFVGDSVEINEANDMAIGVGTSSANSATLRSAGTISDAAGVQLNVIDLLLESVNGTFIDGPNVDVDFLAGRVTSPGDFTFTDSDDLITGTVNGISGVETVDGNITLTAGTDLGVDNVIAGGSGDVTLNLGPTGSLGVGVIDASGDNLILSSPGGITDLNGAAKQHNRGPAPTGSNSVHRDRREPAEHHGQPARYLFRGQCLRCQQRRSGTRQSRNRFRRPCSVSSRWPNQRCQPAHRFSTGGDDQ